MKYAALLFVASGLLAESALAEDWQLAPLLEVTAGHDDNIRLRETDDAASETAIQASLAAIRSTELSETRIDVGAGYTGYSGADSDDLDDVDSARLLLAHRAQYSERMGFEILSAFTLDSVGATARTESEDIDTDEGLTRDEVDRQTIQLAPKVNWDLTEFSTFELGVDYRSIEYDSIGGDVFVSLVDYDYLTAGTRYKRDFSERSSVSLSALYSSFESDGGIDGEGIQAIVAFEHQLSETAGFIIGIGAQNTEIEDLAGVTEDSSGFLYEARFTRKTEVGRLDLIANRAITPSGQGSILERDAIRLIYRQKLSEKFDVILESSFVDAQNLIDSGSGVVNRSYMFVRPRLDYNITEKWSIGASYRFRQNDDKRENVSTSGRNDSNGFFLTLKFEPPSEIGRRY